MKLANLRDKEKILKAAQDKRSITYKGRNIRLVGRTVHTELAGQKGLA